MGSAFAAPEYNFAVIPVVASRHPLWEDRLQESEDRSMINRGYLLAHGRETIGTTPLDGDPELILRMPQDSYSPLVLTLGISLGFAGLLIRNWWAVWIGAIVIALSILVWLWPRRRMLQRVQVAS